jgi:hypothetical protein
MKLTASQLKKIIKEEVSRVLSEGNDELVGSIKAKVETADRNSLEGAAAVALRFFLKGKLSDSLIDDVLRALGGVDEDSLQGTVLELLDQSNVPADVLDQVDMMLGEGETF